MSNFDKTRKGENLGGNPRPIKPERSCDHTPDNPAHHQESRTKETGDSETVTGNASGTRQEIPPPVAEIPPVVARRLFEDVVTRTSAANKIPIKKSRSMLVERSK